MSGDGCRWVRSGSRYVGERLGWVLTVEQRGDGTWVLRVEHPDRMVAYSWTVADAAEGMARGPAGAAYAAGARS